MTANQRPYAEVIGDPIKHSLSPVIHRFWLHALGIEADYRRHRVARADFPAFLAARRTDSDWRGCNVTMPLKLDAVALADDSTDRAVAAGAANLLIPRDGKLLAGNTDVGGVRALFERLIANGVPVRSVTLLGNGGAARAILVALHDLGLDQVRIQSRDHGAAVKLAVEFGLREAPRSFTEPVESDLLVNATPMGMAGQADVAIDISGMPSTGLILDLVTDPANTALLRAARARGLATLDGLDMLVEQAADSFPLLFGSEPPRDRDAALFAKLRA